MARNGKLSICVLGCYPKKSRENFDRSDVGHPHEFFKDFLSRHVPDAAVDCLFIADPETSLPQGTALDSYDGFIWTGSDLTIYHLDDPRVTRQIELAKAIYRAGGTCCGSCWGIQMAAVAAGGEVSKNPNGREWGLARGIVRTDEGRRSLYLAAKPDKYDGFSMHLDYVSRVPAGAKVLAVNPHSRIQALEVRHDKGVFWGTQYHPEYNLYEMARLVAGRAKPLVKEGFFPAEEQARAHADRMRELHRDPGSERLRRKLSVGEDILGAGIREAELRNWIDFLKERRRRER